MSSEKCSGVKPGDYTNLAADYVHRPGYSKNLVEILLKIMGYSAGSPLRVADVGAGTGKFTKVLLDVGLRVDAVEPNDAMRAEGLAYATGDAVKWFAGSGEQTTLAASSYDWVTMASSFHWTDPSLSLPEFARILKPRGYLTIVWNTRNVEASPLSIGVEEIIYRIVPDLRRVSSGSKRHTKNWDVVLTSTGHFSDVVHVEVDHEEVMSKERYMAVWRSVNDVRAQAGEEKFNEILKEISTLVGEQDQIVMPYKLRSWTARRTS